MMQAQDFPLISHSPKRWAEFVRTRSPILESIVQLDSWGRRDWTAMGEDTLLAHAIWKVRDEGIEGREDLKKADPGLYFVLNWRKLLDAVGLEEKYRGWAAMGNDELVAYTKKFIASDGIGGGSWRRRIRGCIRP